MKYTRSVLLNLYWHPIKLKMSHLLAEKGWLARRTKRARQR